MAAGNGEPDARQSGAHDASAANALRHLLAAGQAYRVALARRYDVHVIDMTAMEIIGQSTRPLTQQQLALRLALSPGTLTAIVDRLEAARFVERRRHPVDRRARLISLTPDGRALVASVDRHLSAALSAADPGDLGTAVEQIALRLEDDIRSVAAGIRDQLRVVDDLSDAEQ